MSKVLVEGTDEHGDGTGKMVPKYPQAALLTFLVSWAFDHGLLPSEVWKQYQANPKDFVLLAAFSAFHAEEEKKALEQAKQGK